MRLLDTNKLFSASDLVNFLGCAHSTALDLRQLVSPVDLPPDDDQAELLQEKGIAHERAYLERLRAQGRRIIEIPSAGDLATRVAQTREALRSSPDVIYQGALFLPPWHGFSDFLLKVDDVPSALGGYAYDIADTKLARSAKPKHLLQLAVYADLLEAEQGIAPPSLHVVLGDGTSATIRTADVRYYARIARDRFTQFTAAAGPTAPEPCGHCTFCRWKTECTDKWQATEHLSLVANISRAQREILRAAGVLDMRALAQAAPAIPGIQAATLARLEAQARLQIARRDHGDATVEILPREPGRGFDRLPRPDLGDLFFDMEGDPLYDGGLEYLFGLVSQGAGGPVFTDFWAHDRAQEKVAFEQTIDFMARRLRDHPDAHIYHYAAYEETALKRLAMYHGTREAEVDDLLRRRKLVDLFKVVREGVRVGEPRYSLKNLESYYFDQKRAGEVTTAGDSIVMYERWRQSGEDHVLEEIRAYNEVDCRSTLACRDWLLDHRPDSAAWFTGPAVTEEAPAKAEARTLAEAQTQAMVAALADSLDDDKPWRELLGLLLEFHRREAKPAWWAQFTRQLMSEEELVDDAECIGALRADGRPPRPDKRSQVWGFSFPPQDFKMRVGDTPVRPGTLEPAGEIVLLDEAAGRIELKLGPSRTPLGAAPSLIREGPLGDKVLRGAVFRLAQAVVDGDPGRYAALVDMLRAAPPRLSDRAPGSAIIPQGADLTAATIEALQALTGSYLLVQGPPGAGKTYTASHAIVALLAQGKRVGVASHSHKAINTLLKAIEAVAAERKVAFRGIKKSSQEEQELQSSGLIADTLDNAVAVAAHWQLVAGTAWLFARPELDQALDYLFVDEAGQVSLANLVAMGVSARNIVLIGDQMQLAQPIQGDHPGGSGRSALEHLMDGRSTVPPERGVFLPITRRMHPKVCRFISEAVYDGRLEADDEAATQALLVDTSRDPEALAEAGIRFVDVHHQGCAQRSPDEAARVRVTYETLLGQPWRNRKGEVRPLGANDILVVSPYNMHVNLLQSVLPAGARVGTVDKFQGQEAPVVLVSMATSSGDDLPRQIEFLYSRNRLNVAISRARCLAVVFASPRLLEISCSTVEQMKLVNTLCWAKAYSEKSHMTEERDYVRAKGLS
jgi:predicted RecB family nuclease